MEKKDVSELCLHICEMAMLTLKLTKRGIDVLKSPVKGQQIHWDAIVRGFGLGLLPSGLKRFMLQYRNTDDIKRRVNIGRHGIVTVDQAKDIARVMLAAVIIGNDPAEDARRTRQGMTVIEMYDRDILEARSGGILGR